MVEIYIFPPQAVDIERQLALGPNLLIIVGLQGCNVLIFLFDAVLEVFDPFLEACDGLKQLANFFLVFPDLNLMPRAEFLDVVVLLDVSFELRSQSD